MSDQDKRLARVMGWTGAQEEGYSPNTEWVWRDGGGQKIRHRGPLVSDPVIARLTENEIDRRGLQEAYILALGDVVTTTDNIVDDMIRLHKESDILFIWRLLHATPEQRCEAACIVLESL